VVDDIVEEALEAFSREVLSTRMGLVQWQVEHEPSLLNKAFVGCTKKNQKQAFKLLIASRTSYPFRR
jgi:hypothetical protein